MPALRLSQPLLRLLLQQNSPHGRERPGVGSGALLETCSPEAPEPYLNLKAAAFLV